MYKVQHHRSVCTNIDDYLRRCHAKNIHIYAFCHACFRLPSVCQDGVPARIYKRHDSRLGFASANVDICIFGDADDAPEDNVRATHIGIDVRKCAANVTNIQTRGMHVYTLQCTQRACNCACVLAHHAFRECLHIMRSASAANLIYFPQPLLCERHACLTGCRRATQMQFIYRHSHFLRAHKWRSRTMNLHRASCQKMRSTNMRHTFAL